MKRAIKKIIPWSIAVLTIGGFISFLVVQAQKPGKYDTFAQCINDSGAKFYGAFWCPHCQATKAMFGKSAKKLPYVECSTADGKGQLPICTEKEVKGYPTWIFPDGSRLSGEQTMESLAEKTACPLTLDEK
jgi:thiol-disulfide isomerase/thioredoxin